MVRASSLRRLADDWPVVFAAAVALWFVVAGLGVKTIHAHRDTTGDVTSSSSSSGSSSKIATEAKPDSTETVAGPFKIKVVAFHASPDKKRPGMMTVKTTLELRNTTDQNISFSPSQVSLVRTGDGAPIPPKEDIAIGVSSKVPVTAPLSFELSLDRTASYELYYAGHTVYEGLPF